MVDLFIDLARLAAVGVIAGLFASYRSNRDFRVQRWWERRADAYTRAIEALADLLDYYGTLIDCEMVRADLTEERRSELELQRHKAMQEVVRATKTGAFLFSDEVAESLRILQGEQDKHHDSWFDHLDANWSAVRDCLNIVVESSKRDLKVESTWLGLARRCI